MITTPQESHDFVVLTGFFGGRVRDNRYNPLALIQSSFHSYSNPFALWGFVEVTVCSLTHNDDLLLYDIKGSVSRVILERVAFLVL